MYRLHGLLLIVALATIGTFLAPTPAESQVSKLHVTAAVSGLVKFTGQGCTVTNWEDPVLHTTSTLFPDAPGTKVAFSGLILEGIFVGTTNSFVGEVKALTLVLACAATKLADLGGLEQLLTYGLILPASFSSPVAGFLVLDPDTGSCLYGKIGTGLFLTVGFIAVALIPINYRIDPLGLFDPLVDDPCPVSADHSGPHTVLAIAVLLVVPCGSIPEPCPGPVITDPVPVGGNADHVFGVVTLLPVLVVQSLLP